MGLLIKTYANLVNVWKTSGEAGDQWVKLFHSALLLQSRNFGMIYGFKYRVNGDSRYL